MTRRTQSDRPDDRMRAAASGTEVHATAPRTTAVGGCCATPTDDPQAQATQRPGGGGAPMTGGEFSPAEVVNEEQKARSPMSENAKGK